jgi:hypothetical protein
MIDRNEARRRSVPGLAGRRRFRQIRADNHNGEGSEAAAGSPGYLVPSDFPVVRIRLVELAAALGNGGQRQMLRWIRVTIPRISNTCMKNPKHRGAMNYAPSDFSSSLRLLIIPTSGAGHYIRQVAI